MRVFYSADHVQEVGARLAVELAVAVHIVADQAVTPAITGRRVPAIHDRGHPLLEHPRKNVGHIRRSVGHVLQSTMSSWRKTTAVEVPVRIAVLRLLTVKLVADDRLFGKL